MRDFAYFAPQTLDEALSLLSKYTHSAKILAGGTDLVVQMKEGQVLPEVLIDIKHVPELNLLELKEDGTMYLGASVSLSQLLAFPAMRPNFFLLQQACSLIGSVQLRNRATVGGNICNAAPSADSAPALLCLAARAIMAREGKKRSIPIENFFLGPGKTTLAPGELLLGLEIPLHPRFTQGCYLRHTPRQEMDIGVAGVAALVIFSERGEVCQEARIALGAVAPIPTRIASAEALLREERLTDAYIIKAAEIAAAAAQPISDIRGSAGYRRELVRVLTRRALQRCLALYKGK